MLVLPIASTVFHPFNAQASGYKAHDDERPTSIDELAEMAGRNCYQSWSRPNPKTATNEGYLANILNQAHFSVLEHGSITFYVEGVSRALLTELERHRFLSFSVISQRYVMMDLGQVVIPPGIDENRNVIVVEADDEYPTPSTVRDEFDGAMVCAFNYYELIAEALMKKGLPKKKALEAARSVLPNATSVNMVVTGNLRAWRDVIGKRHHVAADAEIQEFASAILHHLRFYAPNSVQDIPEVPYE